MIAPSVLTWAWNGRQIREHEASYAAKIGGRPNWEFGLITLTATPKKNLQSKVMLTMLDRKGNNQLRLPAKASTMNESRIPMRQGLREERDWQFDLPSSASVVGPKRSEANRTYRRITRAGRIPVPLGSAQVS